MRKKNGYRKKYEEKPRKTRDKKKTYKKIMQMLSPHLTSNKKLPTESQEKMQYDR